MEGLVLFSDFVQVFDIDQRENLYSLFGTIKLGGIGMETGFFTVFVIQEGKYRVIGVKSWDLADMYII